MKEKEPVRRKQGERIRDKGTNGKRETLSERKRQSETERGGERQ